MRALALWCWIADACAAETNVPFPTPFNTEDPSHILTPSTQALAKAVAPPGFNVSLVAAEPDVQNPIAMTFDERGRLWVAENYTYADKGAFDLRLRDRILVFEDTKHNGHFDKRTVFWDGAQRLTSIEIGFGGVWALCAPRLLFIPDRNGDLIPDQDPEVLLDGWNDLEVQHNVVNGLKWGPDGWLYGRHGIQATSFVGKPGSAADDRVKLNCCIWRYHPTRRVFEVVCHGTTNPWGMDWNEVGEAFFINTVIGHLWHMIPGAHYKRMYGEDLNPHVYELIDQHADHYHWDTGSAWNKSRGTEGKASDLGGGHAHSGLMIYQGNNWPEAYRNSLFTINLHGLRLNNDTLTRSGSGYVSHHLKDFVFFNDPWFRGVEVIAGPDGAAYVADWCDIGECHESDGVHRTSGRIYKIAFGNPVPFGTIDFGKLANDDLIKLLFHEDVWFSRQARHELQERAAAGQDLDNLRAKLTNLFERESDPVHKLRVMWTLSSIGGAPAEWLARQLHHTNENVRVWAIRFLAEDGTASKSILDQFTLMAQIDHSAMVRLCLASTLQRIRVSGDEVTSRLRLTEGLIAHSEDASDHNLPLMYWYGIEPLSRAVPAEFADLEWKTEIPLLQKFIARRLAEELDKTPQYVDALVQRVAEAPVGRQTNVLEGISLALRGWRKAPKPASWDAALTIFLKNSNTIVKERATELGAVFGDGRALDELRRVALDEQADAGARRSALKTLIESRAADLLPVIVSLLSDRNLARDAVPGLANFSDPDLAKQLIDNYSKFRGDVHRDVVATLVSRAPFARLLLESMGKGQIPRNDLSAFDARQIHDLNDPTLDGLLKDVWGEVRTSGEDKQQKMAAWQAKLTPVRLQGADLKHGHELFLKVCGVCHRLYGEGASIGPDLTGSGRTHIDYLLENILDPSAVVPRDYKLSVVELKDERVLSGIIVEKKEKTITVQTANERLTVPRDDIQSMRESPLSMMPEGLLDSLKDDEVRDLIAYAKTESKP